MPKAKKKKQKPGKAKQPGKLLKKIKRQTALKAAGVSESDGVSVAEVLQELVQIVGNGFDDLIAAVHDLRDEVKASRLDGSPEDPAEEASSPSKDEFEEAVRTNGEEAEGREEDDEESEAHADA